MRKFLFFIPLFLWTCGGGGGGSSPTEPVDPNPSPPTQLEIVSVEYNPVSYTHLRAHET